MDTPGIGSKCFLCLGVQGQTPPHPPGRPSVQARGETGLALIVFRGTRKQDLKCATGVLGEGEEKKEREEIMFKKIAHRSPTVTVTERPEVNGRAGPQGTDPRVSPSPNVLFWTERVISQKKAHTLFFSRRNHIIWVYRNGELVSEVDFSKGSHLGGGEVGNSYTPGGSGRGGSRMPPSRCEPDVESADPHGCGHGPSSTSSFSGCPGGDLPAGAHMPGALSLSPRLDLGRAKALSLGPAGLCAPGDSPPQVSSARLDPQCPGGRLSWPGAAERLATPQPFVFSHVF